jgi:hypothetical protein
MATPELGENFATSSASASVPAARHTWPSTPSGLLGELRYSRAAGWTWNLPASTTGGPAEKNVRLHTLAPAKGSAHCLQGMGLERCPALLVCGSQALERCVRVGVQGAELQQVYKNTAKTILALRRQ